VKNQFPALAPHPAADTTALFNFPIKRVNVLQWRFAGRNRNLNIEKDSFIGAEINRINRQYSLGKRAPYAVSIRDFCALSMA
jgi:hypothetical protein